MRRDADLEEVFMDSTANRAHLHATGVPKAQPLIDARPSAQVVMADKGDDADALVQSIA